MNDIALDLETPRVPVSWGELIDKITILEIKAERLTSSEAIQNVKTELSALQKYENKIVQVEVFALKEKLREINTKLWEIEDALRHAERDKAFDHDFIALARSVYFTNDERARLKREVNGLTRSHLVEEKSYHSYA